jgi:beta-glucosidase
MKKLLYSFVLLLAVNTVTFNCLNAQQKTIDQRVDSVLKRMTLDEKIGQLNQYTSSWSTGPVSPEGNKLLEIKDGKIGSLLNVKGVDKTRSMQEVAMQSR